MPKKKRAIDATQDHYQKITTISITNNGSYLPNNINNECIQISNHTDDNKDKNLFDQNSSTTEYEIKILSENVEYDCDLDDDDYYYDDNETQGEYLENKIEYNGQNINQNFNKINQEECEENYENFANEINFENENSITDNEDNLAEINQSPTNFNMQTARTFDRKRIKNSDDFITKETIKDESLTIIVDDSHSECSAGIEKKTPLGVPQTLISCLNELQYGGNLISWKITGQGENLSVKITWNNEQKSKFKPILDQSFLNENLENNKLWQIGK